MGLFDDPKPDDIDHWVCILEGSNEFDIGLAKTYLSSMAIPSNILSKRDSAYSLTIGSMARIYLYVPEEFEKKARKALEQMNNGESDTNEE